MFRTPVLYHITARRVRPSLPLLFESAAIPGEELHLDSGKIDTRIGERKVAIYKGFTGPVPAGSRVVRISRKIRAVG